MSAPRIAYLGPAGTFTEDALREAASGEFEPLRTDSIHDAILAVDRGEADRALVPFENSIEGSVRPSLDALAFDATGVTIVGEYDYAVHVHLIAREQVDGLILLVVVLDGERLPRVHVQDLAHVVLGVRPDDFVPPGLGNTGDRDATRGRIAGGKVRGIAHGGLKYGDEGTVPALSADR